jgi:hypothetical protein
LLQQINNHKHSHSNHYSGYYDIRESAEVK